jgi:GGDEF domain-containing protein
LRSLGVFGRPPAQAGRSQLELLVSVILIVATLLLILNGTNFLQSAERWAGESAKLNLIMVMLNVALIIAGLRRLADIQHDNERRIEAERRAAELASSDVVTRLANRKGLADQGMELRHKLEEAGRWMAVISIQLHRFKAINDRHGYETGDGMLRRIAAAVTEIAPEGAIAARLNGDEFALAFGLDAGDSRFAEQVATDVLRRVTSPFDIGAAEKIGQRPLGQAGVLRRGHGTGADRPCRDRAGYSLCA